MIRVQSVYVTMDGEINHGMATAFFEQHKKVNFVHEI